MDFWQVLIDVVILLTGAMVLGGISSRLGQSPLLGYLLAGMLLGGPSSFHPLHAGSDVQSVADLGVSLLLFSLGLEFSWPALRALGGRMLGAGAFQVIATAAIGAVACIAFGLDPLQSIVIGAMISLSSTACVLRVLMDRGDMDSVHGRNSLAILLVQDIAVVPLAVLITVMSGRGSPLEIGISLGKLTLQTAALIVVLYLVVNVAVRHLLGFFTLEKNRELGILLAVAAGLGSAWAAHSVGVSPALGAFVAGMFLGSSPFSTQVRADISSLRVVLLALFFGVAGTVADPVWMFFNLPMVLGLTALLVVGKVVITWLVLRALGQSSGTALAAGLCISQVGEFAFVLGSMAVDRGLLEKLPYLQIVSCTILSLFCTPFLVALAPRLGAVLDKGVGRKRPVTSGEDLGRRVVIVGFGPAGEAAARAARRSGAPVLVLDLNVESIRRADQMGVKVLVGDASQPEVLEQAHVRSARMVVITLPAASAALSVLRTVRALAPDAYVVVRTRFERYKGQLESAGANAVIGDEREVGRKIAKYVATHLHDHHAVPSEHNGE